METATVTKQASTSNSIVPDTMTHRQSGDYTRIDYVGVLKVACAGDFARQALSQRSPRSIYDTFFYEGECCIMFADTNSGKSILAVQIANSAAENLNLNVIYFDLELSSKQFAMRYTNDTGEIAKFSQCFLRAELDYNAYNGDNFEDAIIESIENTILYYDANLIVIDNITFLCLQSEAGVDAGALMLKLMEMKRKLGITMLVVAHTPKRQLNEPLTQNSLAGSKRIANFADSIFAVGRSSIAEDMRYIKQIKSRNSAIIYGSDNVISCCIERVNGMLAFVPVGVSAERDHLQPSKAATDKDLEEKILSMVNDGKSYSFIASQLGLSKSKVFRVVEKQKSSL